MPTLLPTRPSSRRRRTDWRPGPGIVLTLVLLAVLIVGVFGETESPNGSGASDKGSSVSTTGSSSSSGSEHFSVGDTVYSKFDVLYACRSDDDTHKLGDMLERQDHAAITRILLGPCQDLSKPGRLYVENTKVFSYNLCVRPQGQSDCLWTNKGWLTKQPSDAAAD